MKYGLARDGAETGKSPGSGPCWKGRIKKKLISLVLSLFAISSGEGPKARRTLMDELRVLSSEASLGGVLEDSKLHPENRAHHSIQAASIREFSSSLISPAGSLKDTGISLCS